MNKPQPPVAKGKHPAAELDRSLIFLTAPGAAIIIVFCLIFGA
jgi:hypothetical protein